jgi:hypothetical protein
MASHYDTVVLADGPVAYWLLADTSGTSARDAAGSDNGTYSGGFTLGRAAPYPAMSGSVAFDGITGQVSAPNEAALQITGSITVEAWCKPLNVARISEFVCKPSSTMQTPPYIDYSLSSGQNPGAHFAFLLGIAGTWTYAQLNGGTSATNGNWYHVVGTYDGSMMKIYVNGSLDGSRAAIGSVGANSQPLYIASPGAWTGENFQGSVAAVAVYNKALTAAQVLAHYNAALFQGQVPYWHLFRGSNSSLMDTP